MMETLKLFLNRWWIVLVFLLVIPVYSLIAINNEHNVDYVNNGFFTFWLAGHMQWTGEQPYSTTDWVNGHHTNGATWIPNKIFPYPLPLAILTAPLGLLPINQAYIVWDTLAQALIAICILWLATHWDGLNRQLYVIFVLVAAILNGNVFLGLMTGTIAVLFLVFLTLGLYFLETRQFFLAGFMLAGLALKPPLLTVVAMLGIWLVFQRNWKTLLGLVLGGIGLLIIGLIQDINWLVKFNNASSNLLNMRLGNQPTIFSYTRLACSGNLNCALGLYGLIALALVGLYAWLMWKKHEELNPLMAFSAAISIGVLLPPYLWSYDYVLLIIPICYISFDLIYRWESYLQATLFLLLLDIISIVGLIMFWMNPESNALTIQRDMWSIWVAFLVLLMSWTMIFLPSKKNNPKNIPENTSDSSRNTANL
jgi:hypothetical protein